MKSTLKGSVNFSMRINSHHSFNNDVFIFKEIWKSELQKNKITWKSWFFLKITEATSKTIMDSLAKHIYKCWNPIRSLTANLKQSIEQYSGKPDRKYSKGD